MLCAAFFWCLWAQIQGANRIWRSCEQIPFLRYCPGDLCICRIVFQSPADFFKSWAHRLQKAFRSAFRTAFPSAPLLPRCCLIAALCDVGQLKSSFISGLVLHVPSRNEYLALLHHAYDAASPPIHKHKNEVSNHMPVIKPHLTTQRDQYLTSSKL
jgi:hypothetical protein